MLARTLCGIFAVIALSTSATEYRLVDIVAAMYEKGERVLEGPEWGGRWEFRQPGHPYDGSTPGAVAVTKAAVANFANGTTADVTLGGFARTASGAEGWFYPLVGGQIDKCDSVTLDSLTYYPGEVACHPFNMIGEGLFISFTPDRACDFTLAGSVRMPNPEDNPARDGIFVWTYDWNGRMENLNFIEDNEPHALAYGPAAMRKGETFVVRLDKLRTYYCDATAFKLNFTVGAKTIPRLEFKADANLSQLVCAAIKDASASGTVANLVDAGDFVWSFGYNEFEQPAEYPKNLAQTGVGSIFGVQTTSQGFSDLPILGASIADTDIYPHAGNSYMKPVHPGELYFHPGSAKGVVVRLKVKDDAVCANRVLRVKLTDLNPIWGGKTADEHPACRPWSDSVGIYPERERISWGEAMRVYVNGVMRYEGAMRDGTNANANIKDIIADLASFDITDIKAGDEIELRFRALHDYQGEGLDCDATSVALEWGRYRKGIAVIVR